jgi:thioredoxin reductase (NADPH)
VSRRGRPGTDVLRQLPRSGQETRLVLAAYQGPDGGAGLDLLTAATDIAPGAARVLTTTSQDTARPAAAAAARLGLDGWVSDPPAPPHGGLLALLDQHLAHERPPAGQATALTVIGHRWCARTQAARDFLARNEVPFRMVDVTSPTGRAVLLGLGRPTDPGVLPVVVLPDGEASTSPPSRSSPARPGCGRKPGRRCTTSSSAAALAVWAPPSTEPAKGCARCC